MFIWTISAVPLGWCHLEDFIWGARCARRQVSVLGLTERGTLSVWVILDAQESSQSSQMFKRLDLGEMAPASKCPGRFLLPFFKPENGHSTCLGGEILEF